MLRPLLISAYTGMFLQQDMPNLNAASVIKAHFWDTQKWSTDEGQSYKYAKGIKAVMSAT